MQQLVKKGKRPADVDPETLRRWRELRRHGHVKTIATTLNVGRVTVMKCFNLGKCQPDLGRAISRHYGIA